MGLRMFHPDVGEAVAADLEQFEVVHQPNGWTLVTDDEGAYVADGTTDPAAHLGERNPDGSTLDQPTRRPRDARPSVVPDSTIEDVLAYVDGDRMRAEAAVLAENARPKPRKTLLDQLEAITAEPADPEEP